MIKYAQIFSKDNKYLKKVLKLQSSSKERNNSHQFVIEGQRICDDALQTSADFEWIFVSESFFKNNDGIVNTYFKNAKLNFVISDNLFAKISDTKTPQGIAAVINYKNSHNKIIKGKKYIALDNIQDTANLGAIARTCEALGIGGIILANNCCDPFSPKSLRASMGTLLRLPLIQTDNLPQFLLQNKLECVSFVVDKNAVPIGAITFNDNDVIVIGNEANGVSNEVKTASRMLATIPMSGKSESLNAAAAAAIAVYEFAKQ